MDYLMVALTVLVSCQLVETKGLCEFAGMFPSSTNGSTCGNVAKVRNHIDSTATTQLTPRKPTSRTTSPPCSPNMVLGPSCDCEKTCQNPTSCNCTGPETACVCHDNFLINNGQCVPRNECNCYYDGGKIVIPDGTTYVKDDCSERCTCDNNKLSCDSTYTCSPHAACKVKDNVRQCYCNDGYGGDGETCEHTDCYDAYQAGHRENGVFTIRPSSDSPFEVYCDMESNGGGWTVFQRRTDRSTTFTRSWEDYKSGFGSFDDGNDFWLGNEKLYYLTQQRGYKLRVDMITKEGSELMAEYDSFKIGTEEENYKLSDLGSHSGNAGDGMRSAEGMNFGTHDKDNVGCSQVNCVEKNGGGGWWYSEKICDGCLNCGLFAIADGYCYTGCSISNLNSQYGSRKMSWNGNCNIKPAAEMKIRPNIDTK